MKTSTINLTGGTKVHTIKTKKKKKSSKESEPVRAKKQLVSKVEKKAKKKKKRAPEVEQSTELAIIEQAPARAPLSKAERIQMKKIAKGLRHLNSTFKANVPRIHRLISEDAIPQAMAEMSRSFLITLTELIPIMENQVREKPGQSSVYALNAIVSQIREIQADIKADSDQGELALRIGEQIIGVGFHNLGQHMATSLYHLREQIRPLLKEGRETAFDGLYNKNMMELGGFVDQTGGSMKEKVAMMMTVE